MRSGLALFKYGMGNIRLGTGVSMAREGAVTWRFSPYHVVKETKKPQPGAVDLTRVAARHPRFEQHVRPSILFISFMS